MMNETLLFDSLSSPIPELRRDLQVIPVTNNGQNLLYFHDIMGYTSPDFALDSKVEPVLSLINGHYGINQIAGLLNGAIPTDDLLDFVQLLDQHRLLNSKHFSIFSNRIEKDFESSAIRKPALAGESYPSDPEELDAFIDNLFINLEENFANPKIALYAPHIDLRVGSKQYAQAFSGLKHLKPKRVVILATSHYAGNYSAIYEDRLFIGSSKNYKLPGNTLVSDQDYLLQLAHSDSDIGFTLSDRAHRIEHSIELHLLFANHIWSHDFKIVPILVSGIDDLMYHRKGDVAGKVDGFATLLNKLHDDDTFYLVSGDLSHVGKKFGDPLPASQLRKDVEITDQKFLDNATTGKAGQLLDHVTSNYDSTRICGFPPLYTFLSAFPGNSGNLINYHWWDEKERESAVSFGSISY
jgi:MEMO1 family protein